MCEYIDELYLRWNFSLENISCFDSAYLYLCQARILTWRAGSLYLAFEVKFCSFDIVLGMCDLGFWLSEANSMCLRVLDRIVLLMLCLLEVVKLSWVGMDLLIFDKSLNFMLVSKRVAVVLSSKYLFDLGS